MALESYNSPPEGLKELNQELIGTGQFYADLGESMTRQTAEVTTLEINNLMKQNSNGLFHEMQSGYDHLILRVRRIANDPAHIKELEGIRRMLAVKVSELEEKREDGKKILKERAFETRDRAGRVIDHVRPTIEENFYELAAEGELYADEDVDLQITVTTDDLTELIGSRGYYNFEQDVKERGLQVDDIDVLVETLSSADHAQRTAPLRYNAPKFEGAVIFHVDTFKTDFMNGSIVPYGEYGVQLANRQAKSLQRLAKTLKRSELRFNEAESKMTEEELNHFVRAKDNDIEESPTMLSVYEGFISISQALTMLSAQKIEGYEYISDDKLLRDIVDAGLVEQLARILPATGVIGPMSLQGGRFENLVVSEEGKLKLNKDIVRDMHHQRVDTRNRMLDYGRVVDPEGGDKYVALNGCPVALRSPGQRNSDLHDLVEFFMEVFATTDNLPETV